MQRQRASEVARLRQWGVYDHCADDRLDTYTDAQWDRHMKCIDCSRPTYDGRPDYYMVHNVLWEACVLPHEGGGLLCWSCLEYRSGRRLTVTDLAHCPASTARYLRLRPRGHVSLKRLKRHVWHTFKWRRCLRQDWRRLWRAYK